jgi:hypothetical protein
MRAWLCGEDVIYFAKVDKNYNIRGLGGGVCGMFK